MFPDFEGLCRAVRERPELYGLHRTFDSARTWLHGADTATGGAVLDGFAVWLAPKTETGRTSQLTWDGLVLDLTFPKDSGVLKGNFGDAEELVAWNMLFDLLDEFFWIRSQPWGMHFIYGEFARGQRVQPPSGGRPPRCSYVGCTNDSSMGHPGIPASTLVCAPHSSLVYHALNIEPERLKVEAIVILPEDGPRIQVVSR
jgi:hypothetical protein